MRLLNTELTFLLWIVSWAMLKG